MNVLTDSEIRDVLWSKLAVIPGPVQVAKKHDHDNDGHDDDDCGGNHDGNDDDDNNDINNDVFLCQLTFTQQVIFSDSVCRDCGEKVGYLGSDVR